MLRPQSIRPRMARVSRTPLALEGERQTYIGRWASRLWIVEATAQQDAGTSAVEVALILPIFLLLLLCAIDFGQAIVRYNAASEAARDGARVGMVQVTPNPTVTLPPQITSPQATAIASAAMSKAPTIGVATVVPSTGGDSYSGYYVRVDVTTSYQPVVGQYLGINGPIPITASSQINR